MSKVQIKLRRDTAASWTAHNPVLALGEPGLEIDTNQIKFGDGITPWNTLPYPSWVGPRGIPGIGVKTPPVTSAGQAGDNVGDIAVDQTYLYYCTGPYGSSSTIWKRQVLTGSYW